MLYQLQSASARALVVWACLTKLFDAVFVGHFAGLETAVYEDALRAPESVVELAESGGRRSIKIEIDHHLLAPERPAFVKNGMTQQAADRAGVAVGGAELQVVAGIGFVGAGQREIEVLLNLGAFFFGRVFVLAEIVDPEDAELFLVERAGVAVRGGRNVVAQELGNGFDDQRLVRRDGDNPGFLAGRGDPARLAFVGFNERAFDVPRVGGIGENLGERTWLD